MDDGRSDAKRQINEAIRVSELDPNNSKQQQPSTIWGSMSDEESSDDDYDYGDESNAGKKRFPIHDCCEFGDVEALKVR
jgi:hypothetical protein